MTDPADLSSVSGDDVAARADAAEAQVTALRAALTEIGSGYHFAKDAPKRLDECIDLARKTLGIEVEPSPEEGTAGVTISSHTTTLTNAGYVGIGNTPPLPDAPTPPSKKPLPPLPVAWRWWEYADHDWHVSTDRSVGEGRPRCHPLYADPTPPSAEAAGVPDAALAKVREALQPTFERLVASDAAWLKTHGELAPDRDATIKVPLADIRAIKALLAASPSPPSEPTVLTVTDWQLVPKEPDEAMSLAGRKAVAAVADRMEAAKEIAVSVIDFWQQVGHHPEHDIYRAMLAASPSPPSEPTVLPVTRAQVERACAAYLEVSGYRASHTAMEAALNTLMGRKPATESEAE